ncbi:mitochondrial matrix Mmp37-domain-containing protein [Lentinula edodes]|uniref:mitochondrial matrix Mmp37-domain-containing protein n=1 Tax=Lentinula edodes TaxID=5353 RepID=UPI001E8D1887|nr:mitochondrial matrix Mmp37-domain-containing protein [Lentinula edodes]KAH7878028.1 mitochondrial matrix Mmp37-domain-containing protein [Lentinula edodes]
MLSAARNSRKLSTNSYLIARCISTETSSSSSSSDLQNLPPPKHPDSLSKPKARSSLYPRPRRSRPSHYQPLHDLPPTFGRNQLLPVSNSTRALLESIVAQFDAPIRYAFAYGSGVFEQDGYGASATTSPVTGVTSVHEPIDPNAPMLDFMFAVTHPAHFHSINMHQHPSHYTLHSRILGSDYVSAIQAITPGVWFNTLVPMNGVTIKYGVTTIDNLCSDLLNWNTLYLAGRMHKPLRIIKDDARVRLTQQVNLTSAVRAALLTLPANFTETELFERIAGISYTGDPRMVLPAENRGKVGNIVRKQGPQFKELYHRLVVGLPGVHWPLNTQHIHQDISPQARSLHLRKLPVNLIFHMKQRYGVQVKEEENQYWVRMAGDEKLPEMVNREIRTIVRWPATAQTLKGIVSAGLGKSLRYSTAKISKWWKGSGASPTAKSDSS